MLRRFAIVLWWAGLLVGCSLTTPYLYNLYFHAGCGAVVALQADIDKANDVATAKFQENHSSSDPLDALLAQRAQATGATSQAGANDPVHVERALKHGPGTAPSRSALDALIARDQAQTRYMPIDARSTPEHEDRLQNCKRGVDALGVLSGWAFALIAWTLAYIVGGRFWRPLVADPR